MKIGLFGGAFDPVHRGHLALASAALKRFDLDRVVFVPSGVPPHKGVSSATGADRVAMLRLALKSLDGPFSVWTGEISKSGVSYTLDTVLEWRSDYPDADIYFITGSDIFATVKTWKGWREILDAVRFAVAERAGTDFPEMLARLGPDFKELVESGRVILFDAGIPDVSSTVLRNGGEIDPCLVPEAVLKYIEERNLYSGTR